MKVKANLAEEFNAFSKDYTKDMIKCVPYYLELLHAFVENISPDYTPNKILDLGCGNGNVTDIMITQFPNAEYTQVDASEDMLNLCEQRFTGYNTIRINSYFNDFNFKANTFDVILAGFSLHHCNPTDKQYLFKSVFKALKKDGVFMCSDLMINKQDEKHKAHIKNWQKFVLKNYPDEDKWRWLMDHYGEFDNPDGITQQLEWLKQAGFEHFNFNIHGKYWAHFKAYKRNV